MISENAILNNRYHLEKKIGQGGFAKVYLATDNLLKRQVAVKILRSDITDNPDFISRFEQEAQQIASLNHPNILPVFDYGYTNETVYLVMPYVAGGTLNQKIKTQGKLSLQEAGRYLQQMADALDYAHRRNIVHRDIKPHNMLIQTENNFLLLSDFGIAKVVSSTGGHSTTTAAGTPAYMSPEQLRGTISPANDIYALGCVLFQMLTGEVPFSGTTEQVITSHLVEPVPSVVQRSRGQVPPAVQPVIERALAKHIEVRFRTAGEMAKAYHAILNEEITGEGIKTQFTVPTQAALPRTTQTEVAPWVWSPPPNSQPMIPGYYTPAPPDKRALPASKPENKRLLALIGVLVFVLLSAVGTVAFFALSQGSVVPTTVSRIIPTNTPEIANNIPAPTNTARPSATPRPTNTAPTTQSPVTRGKIGETLPVHDHSLTVHRVEKTKTLDRATDAVALEYILVEVTFEAGTDLNLTSELLSLEPTLKDSQDYLYRFISQPFPLVEKTWLISVGSSLKKGDKVKGWVAFQVPEGLQGWLFEFRAKKDLFERIIAKAQVPLDNVATGQYAPPQATGTEGKVTQTVGTDGYFITINKVEKSTDLQTGKVLFPNTKAGTGKQFIAVEVTFESTATDVWAINYGNAVLKDSEGIRYNPAIRKHLAIVTIDLENNTRTKGWITYEVPSDAKNLVFEYADTRQIKTPLRITLD